MCLERIISISKDSEKPKIKFTSAGGNVNLFSWLTKIITENIIRIVAVMFAKWISFFHLCIMYQNINHRIGIIGEMISVPPAAVAKPRPPLNFNQIE